MLRSVSWHNRIERHAQVELARANTILNEKEYRSGAVVMESVPPYLHFSMEVRCNIANDKACVYCAWKLVKQRGNGFANLRPRIRQRPRFLLVGRPAGDRLQYRRADPASRICANRRSDGYRGARLHLYVQRQHHAPQDSGSAAGAQCAALYFDRFGYFGGVTRAIAIAASIESSRTCELFVEKRSRIAICPT